MKRTVESLFVAAILVGVAATPTTSVWARSPASVISACANVETSDTIRPGCAAELKKALLVDTESLDALRRAAQAGDTDAAKVVLTKMGLAEQAVGSAKLVFIGGDRAARVKDISIEISCCPLTIVIKF